MNWGPWKKVRGFCDVCEGAVLLVLGLDEPIPDTCLCPVCENASQDQEEKRDVHGGDPEHGACEGDNQREGGGPTTTPHRDRSWVETDKKGQEVTEATLHQTLHELQDHFPSGVLCIAYPESPAKLYYWWGDRTVCLGHATRLSHGINLELESAETEVGPPLPEHDYGQYL
jgi:hypothetical protein